MAKTKVKTNKRKPSRDPNPLADPVAPGCSVPEVRTAFSPRRPYRRSFTEPSLTKQAFAETCNVNSIMRRFTSTGVIEHLNHRKPNYGFCTGDDFRTSLDVIAQANASFGELPSDIRERFQNNPAEFFDFVQNPENRPEMAEMGLLEPDADVTPVGNGLPPQNASESVTAPENGPPEGGGTPTD